MFFLVLFFSFLFVFVIHVFFFSISFLLFFILFYFFLFPFSSFFFPLVVAKCHGELLGVSWAALLVSKEALGRLGKLSSDSRRLLEGSWGSLGRLLRPPDKGLRPDKKLQKWHTHTHTHTKKLTLKSTIAQNRDFTYRKIKIFCHGWIIVLEAFLWFLMLLVGPKAFTQGAMRQCLFGFVAGKGKSRCTIPFWHPTLADRNFFESKSINKFTFFMFLVIKLTWRGQKLMKICISRSIFGAQAHCNAPRGQNHHNRWKMAQKKTWFFWMPFRNGGSWVALFGIFQYGYKIDTAMKLLWNFSFKKIVLDSSEEKRHKEKAESPRRGPPWL